MKKIVSKLALLLMVAVAFTSCSKKAETKVEAVSTTSTEKAVVLKLNHVMSNNDPAHAAFVQLAKNVTERSNGSLEIQVYSNSELGSNKDNLEQIKNGARIISVADSALMADYIADYSIMNGPFLYQSTDDLEKLYNSDWHKSIEKESSSKGIKILAMDWYFGKRHIISKNPITSVDDLDGLKIRVPSATMWVETMKAMGATPTALQWSEVYSGLEQGVVEAAEAPLSTLYTSKLYEAGKNIALTGHFYGLIGLEMSQKVWDSLSENQQTILVDEIHKQGAIYSQSVLDSEAGWREKLEAEGVTFYDVDNDAFAKKSASVYTKFPKWSAGLYEKVKSAMK